MLENVLVVVSLPLVGRNSWADSALRSRKSRRARWRNPPSSPFLEHRVDSYVPLIEPLLGGRSQSGQPPGHSAVTSIPRAETEILTLLKSKVDCLPC